MSIFAGTEIVNDGLVFMFDPINPKCFRGEPTTNLITGQMSANIGVEVTSVVDYDQYNALRTLRKIKVLNASGIIRSIITSSIGVPVVNQYYTVSMWIKRIGNINVTAGWEAELQASDGYARPNEESGYIGNYNQNPNVNTVATEWQRVSYTFRYTSQRTSSVILLFYLSGLNGEVLISDVQAEAKSYATPYVVGSRGSTVATGGGLIDLLGSSNGELVNGPIYNATAGSLIFDGTNDRVSTANINLSSTDKISVCFWCKILAYTETAGAGKIIFEISDNFNNSLLGCNVAYADASNGLFTGFPITLNLKGNNGYNLSGFSKTLVNDLGWHHWGCIFDKSLGSADGVQETILYIDAIERSPTMIIAQYRINNTNNFGSLPLHVGQRTGNVAPANIEIAAFQIYNRVLSAAEILQNYNATKARFGL